MKFPKLSSLLVLGLAFCVTTGAMSVTVSAAAQEEALPESVDDALIPAPAAVAPIAVDELPPVPATGAGVIPPDAVPSDRSSNISLDDSDGFSGRLFSVGSGGIQTPSASMTVQVIRDGAVIASTVTDQDGGFHVSGLGEGVVAIYAHNDLGLLLYGARLVNDGNVFADATPVKFVSDNVQHAVNSATVPPSDVVTVRQLLSANLPSGEQRFVGAASDNEQQYPFGTGELSTTLNHHAVQLQPNGSLEGQLQLMDPRTGRLRGIEDVTLHFVKGGEHVAATEVQNDGKFQISGLTAGIYSVVGTGADGIMAVSVELVGALVNLEKDDRYKLTSVAQALDLTLTLANAGNAGPVGSGGPNGGGDVVLDGATPFGSPAGGPMAGTPGGGSGTGGGGAGAGGGGLGAVLGALAGGAIGYALADDRDATPNR